MNKTPIAILMTCHNRRDKTLDCLRRLAQQDIEFTVYLVDDGSSDNTAVAVESEFPDVKVLSGDGSLFWVGGMRLAFAEAMATGHDYYIWLNDDTMLYDYAVEELVQTHEHLQEKNQRYSIVVGSVRDPITKQQTYGGRSKSKKMLSFKFEPVEPCQEPKKCDTFQGNIVLIPHSVAERVGNIDASFIHNFGDLDYGLRAVQAGCSVWVAPGYIGECFQNSYRGSWIDQRLSIAQRMKKAIQVKSFPLKPWTTYLKRHAGPLWFLRWPLPYIRAVIGYRDLKNSPTFYAELDEGSG
jgi:GT2 family glycosyltransferase